MSPYAKAQICLKSIKKKKTFFTWKFIFYTLLSVRGQIYKIICVYSHYKLKILVEMERILQFCKRFDVQISTSPNKKNTSTYCLAHQKYLAHIREGAC